MRNCYIYANRRVIEKGLAVLLAYGRLIYHVALAQ